jgi:hypothetical protein
LGLPIMDVSVALVGTLNSGGIFYRCGAGQGGTLGNTPNPRAGPSFSFFVPTATYDDLVMSREERHNTTPTGKTGKNTTTMVAEPPSSPATWS